MASYKGITIKPGTDAELAAQVASIDTKPATPITPGVTPAINISDLNKSPEKPMTPVSPPVATSGSSLASQLESNADSFQTNLNKRSTSTETAAQTSLQDYIKNQLSTATRSELTDKAYKGTVDPAETELNQINADIIAEQQSVRRAEEQLRKNPQGLYGGALEQQIQDLRDKSLARQADLSVVKLARQGAYDSAKSIADRAVQAQFERDQLKNDALKFTYEENKDLFTTAEKRAFETAQADRERSAELNAYKEKSRYDQILKQSDPLYQLQIAREQKEISLLGEPTDAENKTTAAALREAKASVPVLQDKLSAVDILKEHEGLNSRVGPTPFSRSPQGILGTVGRTVSLAGIPSVLGGGFDAITGSGQDFSGGVHKLVGGLTLDNLIAAKARGATFGALSDSELQILANSASSINDWEIKDKNGKGTGFWDIDQASFNKELDTIKQLTNRALVQAGQNILSQDENDSLDEIFNNTGATSAASYY